MFDFILTSALLGLGLAMDAFSVSLANGLNEPDMRRSRRLLIAGTDPSRRGRNWFLECVKMTYGADSAEFKEARESNWASLRVRWS